MLRLARPVAAAPGDRFVLRRPSPGMLLAGGMVLEPAPARGVSRRRQTTERVAVLAAAVHARDVAALAAARLDLRGASLAADASLRLAPDVLAATVAVATSAVAAWHADHPAAAGLPLAALRALVSRAVRRAVTLTPDGGPAAADLVVATAIDRGSLIREGDQLRRPEHRPAGPDPELLAAMDRLEAALTGDAPPPLAATADRLGCPASGIRALEQAGRIVVLEPDLAWAAAPYRQLAARALVMALRAPLTPAAFRDATGTSRRYCLAILEDLDRRGILRRTEAGHVPGPKAPPLPGRPAAGPAG